MVLNVRITVRDCPLFDCAYALMKLTINTFNNEKKPVKLGTTKQLL